jgi:hypothetical protein
MPVTTRFPEPATSADLEGLVGTHRRTQLPGILLLGALLLELTYAAFAHGATHVQSEGPLQAALALTLVVAAAVWLWHGGLALSAPRTAWVAVGLLSAFAVWTGITLTWSLAPDRTWVELNRAIAYVLVIVLALAAGSWSERTVERLAVGYLAVAVGVSLYALGGKIAPGAHIGGLINLNQTSVFPRLRAPLDYWNALAMVTALGMPLALRLAGDQARSLAARLAALLALTVLLVTLGLTYSRGGVVALVVCVIVLLVLTGPRLRTLLALVLALAAAVPPLAYAFSHHALKDSLVALSKRERPGLVLGLILLASLVALASAGRILFGAEQRVRLTPARARQVGLGLAIAGLIAIGVGIGAAAFSHRGLSGTVSHQWHTFTTAKEGRASLNPAHLLSVNSSNRWVWWQEAVGAWSDRPLRGWGAGSFAVLHHQYRRNSLNALQPHSVPLQFLAETGIVGAILAMAGIVLLVVAAVGTVRRMAVEPARGFAAALTAGAVAWLVHGLYEWDWDIPGVLLPGLVFLGVVAGSRGAGRTSAAAGGSARVVALGATGVLMAAVAVSALLPAWSDWKTTRAIDEANARSSKAQLANAAAQADLASRLNPLAAAPLFAAASIAEQRGRPQAARRYLLRAIAREPHDVRARYELASFDLGHGNLRAVLTTIKSAVALDPHRQFAARIAAATAVGLVSPNDSATATGTPLPSGALAF